MTDLGLDQLRPTTVNRLAQMFLHLHTTQARDEEKRKEDAQKAAQTFGVWRKMPNFANDEPSAWSEGRRCYFCTRADGGIQGVKSGSFFPVMLKRCLCECAPCSSATSHR